MLEFDKNGNLYPYEAIESRINIVEETFVTGFKDSKTRFELFKAYLEFKENVQHLVETNFVQFVNGSFVTRKLNPNDIDIVCFIDFRIYEQKEKRFNELKVTYKVLNIDCYFVKKYPEKHKYFIRYRTDMLYWNDLFTKSRKRQAKGYLKLKL